MTNIHGTCDRCGPAVRATNRWVKGDTLLEFCTHHSNKLAAKLVEAGFAAGGHPHQSRLQEHAGAPR